MEKGKSNLYMQIDVQSTLPGSANAGRNAEFLVCSWAEITSTLLDKRLGACPMLI